MNSMRKVLTYSLLLVTGSAYADLIIEQHFYFGKIAIPDNNSVSTVTIPVTGTPTSTSKILIIEPGHPGVYTLTEFSPYTTISLSADIPAYSNSPIPGTQQFIITALDIPTSIKTDSTGSVQFKIGGTLSTSGLGGTYQGPASYSININIDLNF